MKPGKIKSFPAWFSPEPLQDDSRPLLKDKFVLEVTDVFATRYPAFAKSVADPSLKQPLQTICHGDFHSGNHMYGRGENKGKIVALDYQGVGIGLVAQDVVEFLMYIAPYSNFGELSKVHHSALVENEVTD